MQFRPSATPDLPTWPSRRPGGQQDRECEAARPVGGGSRSRTGRSPSLTCGSGRWPRAKRFGGFPGLELGEESATSAFWLVTWRVLAQGFGELSVEAPAAHRRNKLHHVSPLCAYKDFQRQSPEFAAALKAAGSHLAQSVWSGPVGFPNCQQATVRGGNHRVEADNHAAHRQGCAAHHRVSSPEYLAWHPRPKVPGDLQEHNFFRQPFWSLEKRSRATEITVTGSPNDSVSHLAIRAALDGIGIARVPAIYVSHTLRAGGSSELLEDRTRAPLELFLCYPSRRHLPAALQAFIDALKRRRGAGYMFDVHPRPACGSIGCS